jgi:hypothetical protein
VVVVLGPIVPQIRPLLKVADTLTDADLDWVNQHLKLADAERAIRNSGDLQPAMPARKAQNRVV